MYDLLILEGPAWEGPTWEGTAWEGPAGEWGESCPIIYRNVMNYDIWMVYIIMIFYLQVKTSIIIERVYYIIIF